MGEKINFKCFFVFLFLFTIQIKCQNYKLTYNIMFKPIKKDTLHLNEKAVLLINKDDNTSFFESINSEKNISFKYKVYKNFNKDVFYHYEFLTNLLYKTKIDFNVNGWRLVNDQKNIMGYKCNKAIIKYGDREWIAWYSNEIPIQDGPYVFYGLPGIILEISSADNDYKFYAVGIENSLQGKIELPQAIMLKKEQLTELKKRAVLDPSEQYRQRVNILKSENIGFSLKFNNKEITSQTIIDNLNKDLWNWLKLHDNPIEKEDIWTN